MVPLRELTNWLSSGADPETFPYLEVVAEFQRTGKHFVDKELLALLDQCRAAAGPAGPLRAFLDIALDKWDGCYDYRTYLALPLLRMPRADRDANDRLLLQLIADALAFELAAEDGDTDLLPEQRPEPALVTKRYRLGLRAASPVLARLGLPAPLGAPQPAAALHALVVADQSTDEERDLRLSMLPVYVVHDEYMFIRVLQAYECMFASLAAELRSAIAALDDGLARPAADHLAYARDLLDQAGPLFSLIATMQPDSFRTFRLYTEGASAIQSRSYKLVEALCRTPEESRLESPAFRSVPDIRDRVLAGQPSIEQAYRAADRAGRLPAADRQLLDERMADFAAALLQWRQTHYRIATRMLGNRTGTGYTEGTPYLAAVRSIPVFTQETGGDPE
ncbi:tryptophan 2,3-dioxygenase family protein [Polymorphospora sp. NPDC050346]|uniref:tryptophan 2,3-dioxygenase family protein n=1 Tax=Polymorphospora sp. NPDC050346 TaxID=3155780 RepID=UPI0033CAC2A9